VKGNFEGKNGSAQDIRDMSGGLHTTLSPYVHGCTLTYPSLAFCVDALYGCPLKPNSITLDGSKLVRSWSPTSFEPASVMEFGY